MFPAKTLRAAAFTISALLATAVAVPAAAQVSVSISFDNFHNRLSPYGTWSNHPRWGEVWHPRAGRDFSPYYNGHWEDTQEYGWLWVSDDAWGDIPYHYGRWVSDPREGWLWVPGYVWGPSWVVWREGGGNIGWFPMPPGDDYYGDGAYRDNFDNQYGYRDWYGPSFGNDQFLSLWTFVGEDHFRDRNFRNYAVPQRDYGRFFSQTRNTTNYATINNYVVNRSIDESRFRGYQNQRFQPVPARNLIGRDAPATQADTGRQVEQRERQLRPIPVNINPAERQGRGNLNSNAQQQNRDRTPEGFGGRGPNSNGPRQSNPQNDRGTAAGPATPSAPADTSRQNGRGQANVNPAEQGSRENLNSNAQRQNRDRTPEGFGGRGPNSNGPRQSNPQIDRGAAAGPATPPGPAADTSRQNGRGQANLNPAEQRGRGGDRERNSNGPVQSDVQTGRSDPVANTPPPKGNVARQGLAERGNRASAPQTREAPQPNAKVIVQDTRTPPRIQGNVPATSTAVNDQGNARNVQARGNRQSDAKTDDRKAADDEKKAGGGNRGRN